MFNAFLTFHPINENSRENHFKRKNRRRQFINLRRSFHQQKVFSEENLLSSQENANLAFECKTVHNQWGNVCQQQSCCMKRF